MNKRKKQFYSGKKKYYQKPKEVWGVNKFSDEFGLFIWSKRRQRVVPTRAAKKGVYLWCRSRVLFQLGALQTCLIWDGKKARAERWILQIIKAFESRFQSKRIAYFKLWCVFVRITPKIFLRKFHAGRTPKIVGVPLFKFKRPVAAAHLIIRGAKERSERGFINKLIAEMFDICFNKPHTGSLKMLRQLRVHLTSNKNNIRLLSFINSSKI